MIIKHFTDNDLYKFTMQYGVVSLYPSDIVKYKFTNRGSNKFPKNFAKELRKEIDEMANLKLTDEEYQFMKEKCYYLPQSYLDFLRGFRFDPSEIKINEIDDKIEVEIEGFWYRTILWEVPLMALISELNFKMTGEKVLSKEERIEKADSKMKLYQQLGIKVADFGTRRRYSFENQDTIVNTLNKYSKSTFVGTSNVYLAMKYKTTPIGTHAHEWFMFHAAKYGYKMANKVALENWVKVYRGDLGIALSDTFTTEVFFRDFDTLYAKLFDGVRHDSGSPLEFADKTIKHYEKLRINPLSKTIVFSDGLDPEMVKTIVNYCKGRIGMSFGIGTNFTNDVGVKPLNMVIKLKAVKGCGGKEWTEVVKLSDNPGKHTGDKIAIKLAKDVLDIK
ncbi:MAG: nicotinate phosphoribosyltransferase [Bacteroidales bacterium]|nr:nicotinate phosphoribosyltransferase [Bacteroidales bacterium]